MQFVSTMDRQNKNRDTETPTPLGRLFYLLAIGLFSLSICVALFAVGALIIGGVVWLSGTPDFDSRQMWDRVGTTGFSALFLYFGYELFWYLAGPANQQPNRNK